MKKMFKILVPFVLIIVVILTFFKDQFIKRAIVISTQQILGASAQIEDFSLSILKQSINIKGFKIYNPSGFPNEAFVDIPEVGVDYDLGALLKQKLHLPFIRMNLKEMILVRNKEGKLNVESLKINQQKDPAEEREQKKTKKEEPSVMPMQIDQLSLTIGKVIYKDFSGGGDEPTIKFFDVGIHDKIFKDINSPQQLAAVIMVEATKSTAIKGLSMYGLNALLGVGFVPVGVVSVLTSKDHAKAELDMDVDNLYQLSLEVIKSKGEVINEEKESNTIKANVKGASVVIKIDKLEGDRSSMTVSARKLMIPNAQLAESILYQISQQIK